MVKNKLTKTDKIVLLAILLASAYNAYTYILNREWDWKLLLMSLVLFIIWLTIRLNRQYQGISNADTNR